MYSFSFRYERLKQKKHFNFIFLKNYTDKTKELSFRIKVVRKFLLYVKYNSITLINYS